ncbi:hypothetical protein TSAR_003873 [Trichomalopsis sarcophagae]|uniref:Uncharacterized protein n=1 Tax=Trichomalopsis sarcophagae TaxID=543379 RepID=A0A232F399_9HYME|nr:hypothetical protein TSAR_003873 [Trichomalopsis sarcophagae]
MACIDKQLSVSNRIASCFKNFKKTGQSKMTDHLTNVTIEMATVTGEMNLRASESLNLRDKLHIITLLAFSGEIHECLRFRDTFTEMIASNANLALVYKVHYLNQALSKEASKLLEEIPASGDNFADSWKLIKDHYDNTRLIDH